MANTRHKFKTADQPLTIMGKIIWINSSRSLGVEFFMIILRLVSPLLKDIEDSEITTFKLSSSLSSNENPVPV